MYNAFNFGFRLRQRQSRQRRGYSDSSADLRSQLNADLKKRKKPPPDQAAVFLTGYVFLCHAAALTLIALSLGTVMNPTTSPSNTST